MLIVALATLAAAQAPVAAAAPQPDPNKRICKTVESIGSRIGRQLCRTRAQWQDADRADAENARELMSQKREVNLKGG